MIEKNEAAKGEDKDSAATQKNAPILAQRKTCTAEGTGLSHYVLMDKPVKR